MTDSQATAWQNGRQLPFTQAAVPVRDLGVVAGAAVSEMARTYGHQPFRLRNHLTRLFKSCRELGFPLPYTESELEAAATDIVQLNTRALDPASDLGIVWFITAGANPTYIATAAEQEPAVCVHTFELPLQRWLNAVQSGVQLTIPAQRQLPADSFPVQHKTRNRLHWWLADRAAAEQRPGSRALLLDAADNITETSFACFYAVVDGSVVTARDGVLRSTTRDVVRELCDRLGLRYRETDLPIDRLNDVQEAFLSSTPCGLLSVASIDDHLLPGPDGPVIQQLQREWTALTGVNTFDQILQA